MGENTPTGKSCPGINTISDLESYLKKIDLKYRNQS